MLITEKDIKQLEEIDLFNFNYLSTKLFNNSLHKQLVAYIKSQNFKSIKVFDLDKMEDDPKALGVRIEEKDFLQRLETRNAIEILFTPKELQKHKANFLNSFIGKELTELEPFFINYHVGDKILKFFQKKNILALDPSTTNFIQFCNALPIYHHYYNENIDFNLIYKHYEKIFPAGKTQKLFDNFPAQEAQKLFEKYLKGIKKHTDNIRKKSRGDYLKQNADETFNIIKGLIAFKRPIQEFEDLLIKNHASLGHSMFKNMVDRLDKTLMPDIVTKIQEHIEKSKELDDNLIEINEIHVHYKAFEISVESLCIKYKVQQTYIDIALQKQFNMLKKVFEIKFHALNENNDRKGLSSYMFIGEAEKILLAHKCLKDIINNKKLFLESREKDLIAFCQVVEEKELMNSLLSTTKKITSTNKL